MTPSKTIFMETTTKSVEQTAAEIQKELKDYGLKQFMFTYDGGEIAGVHFSLEVGPAQMSYRLPINHRPLWVKAQKGQTKYIKTEDQARKVAWRQTLRWIEAQLALVDTGMVELPEVFLPYMLAEKERTVYELYQAKMPALSSGRGDSQ